MTEVTAPCVCTLARRFAFDTPEAARKSSDLAVSLARNHRCDHVAVGELLPRDCHGGVVLFANCYDIDSAQPKCRPRPDGDLLLFALRPIDPGKATRTVSTTIIVTSVPAHAITIEGGDEKDDKCTYSAGSEVLRPYFRSFTRHQYWHKRLPISIRRMEKSVSALINVKFDVDNGTIILPRALPLDVNIPPEGASGSSSDLLPLLIMEPTVEPFGTTIAIECVKFLLNQGLEGLKKLHPFSADEIITLDIGGQPVTPSDAPERIERLIKESASNWKVDPGPVLSGIKHRIEILTREKGFLIADLSDAVNVRESAQAKVRISKIEEEIGEYEQEMWMALQSTGSFRVLGAM